MRIKEAAANHRKRHERITRDVREVKKALRYCVFNLLMNNRAGHAKNLAFLLDQISAAEIKSIASTLPIRKATMLEVKCAIVGWRFLISPQGQGRRLRHSVFPDGAECGRMVKFLLAPSYQPT